MNGVTKITKKYWMLITTRNYLPDYDEEGYQVGRSVSNSSTYLIQNDNPEELLEEENKVASGCDESFDCSTQYSRSLEFYLQYRRNDCEVVE